MSLTAGIVFLLCARLCSKFAPLWSDSVVFKDVTGSRALISEVNLSAQVSQSPPAACFNRARSSRSAPLSKHLDSFWSHLSQSFARGWERLTVPDAKLFLSQDALVSREHTTSSVGWTSDCGLRGDFHPGGWTQELLLPLLISVCCEGPRLLMARSVSLRSEVSAVPLVSWQRCLDS